MSSALQRLKDISNKPTGRKRKDDTVVAGPPAKGGPGQDGCSGEGFTEAQLDQLARLINSSVTSAVETAVEKSVGSFKEDMFEIKDACVDAIEEQNSTLAAFKSEIEDMKAKIDEAPAKGSAAVRGASAPPRSIAPTDQENLFCGPRKLPSYDQRKKDIIYASDKLNMIFEGKIESDKAMETVERAIKDQGPLEAKISIAEVHHEVNKTRIVVKFEKTSTMKASQNRTAARNKWSPIDSATGRPTYPLTDDDLSEVKVSMFSPAWMKEYYDPLYEIKTMYTNQFSVDSGEVRIDKKRNLLLHGTDALAVLRFDGSVVLTPFLLKKNVSA